MARAPHPPEREIECVTLRGGRSRHPAEEFRFRPAAYGIARRGDLVLLGRSAFSGRWDLPGGGVEPWETLAEGMKREFREETGVSPLNPRLFRVLQGYFSIYGRAYNSLRFYYVVDLPDGFRDDMLRPDPDEIHSLGWQALSDCAPDEFTDGIWDLLKELVAAEV